MAFSHRSYLSAEERTEFVLNSLASLSSTDEEQAETAESLEDEFKIRPICGNRY